MGATRRGRAAVHLVAATGGNPSELLDVDVDQLARPCSFVASDGLSGLTIDVIEAVQVVPAEDPVDGRRRQVEVDRQTIRPNLFRSTAAADLGLDPVSHPGRGTTGTAGAVVQPVHAQFQVAVPPLRGTPPRDTHGPGHMSNRRPSLDPPTQQQSTLRREWSVTVTHGDLRLGVLASSPAHLLPEVSLVVDPYRVTNVRGKNS
jgi:hypothetical protein